MSTTEQTTHGHHHAGFVHLHVHSEYSVLDGQSKIYEIIDRCQKYGMRACALTDHGALFGVLEFYQAARKAGIKPIIGSELYVAKGSRFDKTGRSAGASSNHFLLLCENDIGYHNLCKLSSLGYTEGFHYKPRVDFDLLKKYSEGLIATSACLAGEIPQFLMNDDRDSANEAIKKYVEVYGRDNFLIEIMDHGIPEQIKINPMLAELAEHHGLMVIATNDCHYTDKDDATSHEALLAIQTAATLDQEDRFKFPTPEFYIRSGEEMAEKFKDCPEAIANTEKVAARCNVELKLGNHLIPSYEPPDGFTKEAYLRHLVIEGLNGRYHNSPTDEHVKRANFELDVIVQMGFTDYFLVVWDLIAFARKNDIPVGPGRGSGAGSLVAYALKITNIDPMRYALLFERFLNPERISMPDFDLDFCYNRRGEVIEYARAKYGQENVSQIITFGRMKARQAVRNVGRVLGMPYGEVDKIAKLISDDPALKITLAEAAKQEPELQRLIKDDEKVKQLWQLATRLEGTIGNCGTHAAGVVICDQPLVEHVPLFQAAGSDVVATQFEMKGVEEVGLLKMDFLGLRTLTVVHDAVRFIKENRGAQIDIDNLEPNDSNAYAVLRSGKTMGIFQLESSGMRDLAKRIGLESLEEICALVALYRPGPMQLKDQYIENKHNKKKIHYDHPLLEPILRETYGVALYQEQVMQIVQAVAGFTLGQADILRRAMGKKKADLMAEQRDKFVDGAVANGIDKNVAMNLFNKIEQFAGYGFNKSHSMAYAYVAYQTAYLKANYPAEFMAALLTSESGNLDKVGVYVEECRRLNIDVLPPDINSSYTGFTVEGNSIRFGMGAVKNVGAGPVEAIAAERDANGPYKDIFDFCKRIDSRLINRRVIESLNKAGAFASTGWNRRQVEQVLDAALNEGQLSQRDRDAGQTSLLDLVSGEAESAPIHTKPNIPEWPENELLQFEKEMLGLYVSSHPLAKYSRILERYSSHSIAALKDLRDGTEVTVGGLIANVKQHITQRGNKKMAFVTLETLEGPCEVTVFPDLYEQKAGLLVSDMAVMIAARISFRNDEPGLIASDVIPIDEAPDRLTRAVHIRLTTIGLDETLIERLAEILGERPGKCDVYLHCVTPEHEDVTVHATSACKVAPSQELCDEVEGLLGEDTLWFSGANGLPRHE
ncbi:MAG: DNA polymerase III subunit alpha [Candidatus Hydrogenedentes bacterium]|nr:DNA polymerase III subunit alpha [Candidatus Hydrogenedentota bacterium]